MTFLKSILLAAAMLIATQTGFAKTIEDAEKIEQISAYFMQQVTKGETEAALTLISAYLGVDTTSFEQRATSIISDMKRIEQSAGKAISYAALDTQRVGEHFFKTRYLLKYRQAAIVWELNFYQPENGWVLVDVSLNTDIDALFEN